MPLAAVIVMLFRLARGGHALHRLAAQATVHAVREPEILDRIRFRSLMGPFAAETVICEPLLDRVEQVIIDDPGHTVGQHAVMPSVFADVGPIGQDSAQCRGREGCLTGRQDTLFCQVRA